jgi:L-ribulose-5-phosphate 4-epimerase
MTDEQVQRGYEEQTAAQIVAAFRDRDYLAVPGVLVASHGPFTWGRGAQEAVYHSLILERIAHMNLLSLVLNPSLAGVSQRLLDKHFQRKHGPQATYGQREKGIPDR